MTLAQLASFAAAAMALLIIPGPSVLFVISRGIALGRRAALATVAGNTMGALVHAVAVAAGVGAVVARSAVLFDVMKYAGAGYLAWLGVRAIRDRQHLADALHAPVAARTTRQLVRDGFVVGVSNPKAILFLLAVLPQFVRPEAGHVSLQLLVLGVLFCLLAVVNDGLYGIGAGSVRSWLERRPQRLSAVGGASGVVMLALGVRLALTGRND